MMVIAAKTGWWESTCCRATSRGVAATSSCRQGVVKDMATTRRNSKKPARPRKRVRLADVAAATGVSRTVVGQVLNGGAGNSRVGDETAHRIREVARTLNYRPNLAARQLRGKRTQTYGLLVASAGDPLRSFLVQHLDIETSKVGSHTIIGNTIGREEPNYFGYYVDEFARRGVDGVFCAVHEWFGGDRQALVAQHPNTVFYGKPPQVPSPCCVEVDREHALRIAVRHLVERGRRRIGLAVTELAKTSCQARLHGYRQELKASGVPFDEQLLFSGDKYGRVFAVHNERTLTWDYPTDVIDRCVEELVIGAKADAVVAHDDFWGAALVRGLRKRGLHVPDDVAVVGYLNHYLADWTDPPLTTIDLQHSSAAAAMVELMEEMVAGKSIPVSERTRIIKPVLVPRDST